MPGASRFCPKCGSTITPTDGKKIQEVVENRSSQILSQMRSDNTPKRDKKAQQVEEYKLNDKEIEQLSNIFVSKDEKYTASLGNGYIMNYLAHGTMRSGFIDQRYIGILLGLFVVLAVLLAGTGISVFYGN